MFGRVTEMQKEIHIHGSTLSYLHKKSTRSKTMKLAVYHDGRIVVTTPRFILDRVIESFFLQKASWIMHKLEYFKSVPKKVKVIHSDEEITQYKIQAAKRLEERLPHFATQYGVTYKNVVIKNIRSRWGSCSSKGNLNFNYKIALLSPELADYIIVHELCHLKEMNHGEKFWKLVEEMIPNHKELRRQLKSI